MVLPTNRTSASTVSSSDINAIAVDVNSNSAGLKTLQDSLSPTAFDLRKVDPTLMVEFDRIGLQSVMQHAIKDTVTGHYFVSQAQPSNLANAEHTIISEMTSQGVLIKWARFVNFGHGTTIALEYVSGAPWLWMNANTVDATTGTTTVSDLVRVNWNAVGATVDGVDIVKTHASVAIMNKFTTAYVTASLDPDNDWIVLRESSGSAPNNSDTYKRRKLSELKAGVDVVYNTLGPFWLDKTHAGGQIMQGFSNYGDTFFRYTGDSNQASDPHIISAFSWAAGTTTPLYTRAVGDLAREPGGKYIGPGAGFSEPEGIYCYKNPAGKVVLLVGFTVNTTSLARQYRVYGFIQDDAAAETGPLLESLSYFLPVNRDRSGRPIGAATTIATLDRVGWYYMTSTEFAAMTDRPMSAPAGGYWVMVSGMDAGMTTGVQRLIRNTTQTSGAETYQRVVNFSTGVAGLWSRISMGTEPTTSAAPPTATNAPLKVLVGSDSRVTSSNGWIQFDAGTNAIVYTRSGNVHGLTGTLKSSTGVTITGSNASTAFTLTGVPEYVAPLANVNAYGMLSSQVGGVDNTLRIIIASTGIIQVQKLPGVTAGFVIPSGAYIPFSASWVA